MGWGGIVDDGEGEVRARMRAAARGSAWVLNSERGVIWWCGLVVDG